MKQSTFWREASFAGAVIGLATIALGLVGMLMPKINNICSLAAFVVTVYLLFHFSRKRANQFQKEGFGYSQVLGFITAIAIFSGIVSGAYQIVASNFLFTEHYEDLLTKSLEVYSQMGGLDNKMMDSIEKMSRMYIFSPLPVLLSNIIGNILYYGFLGLFIAIGVKRDPAIFDIEDDEEL